MPVKTSLKSSDKVRKKVKVSSGKLGGLSDVKPRSKGSDIVRSKGSRNGDAISDYVNEKSGNSKTGRRRNMNANGEEKMLEMVINGDTGRKRKRVYAVSGRDEDRILNDSVEKRVRSYLSKGVKGGIKNNMDKEKQTSKGNTQDVEELSRKFQLKGDKNLKQVQLTDKKNLRGKVKGADKDKVDLGDGSGKMSKKNLTTKNQSMRQLNQNNSKRGVEKPGKKNSRDKKSISDDLEAMEDRPKKKKRVIRIDPHDTSNKRLDDGISSNDNSKKKKDLAENSDAEMSKNAQFRAIRPSSSVLSFVEDNLLGRRRDIEFRRAGYNTELSAPLDNIPFSTSLERERIEVPVFRNKLEFFAAAKISSSFPPPDVPEIAFAGRSNVGKSSLLNSLTRQWGVVRTSDKPGLTQTINFFKLGPKLRLVDLPGYGFAYAKEEVKEAWEELVKEYVSTRAALKRVCLLIDTKWGMKPRDHELIDLMEKSQTKYQVVLTKTDLVFPIDVARRAMQIEESLKAKKSAVQPVMMVSSKTGAGIRSLRTVLANIGRFVKR